MAVEHMTTAIGPYGYNEKRDKFIFKFPNISNEPDMPVICDFNQGAAHLD